MLAALVVTAFLPIAAVTGLVESGSEVPAAVPALRIGLVFVTLLFAFRLIGKRELGRLSPFELVTLMLVPEVLSSAMQGEGSLLNGLIGMSTLLALVTLTSALTHRFEVLERVVEAQPTVLVAHGALVEASMNDERITPDEVFSEMHKQGLSELSEVAWAVLEPSGNITFVPARPSKASAYEARSPEHGDPEAG